MEKWTAGETAGWDCKEKHKSHEKELQLSQVHWDKYALCSQNYIKIIFSCQCQLKNEASNEKGLGDTPTEQLQQDVQSTRQYCSTCL